MICFPLDNTEYGAEALGAYLSTRTRGVAASGQNLAVTAASGMSVAVSPGLAWLKYAEYWGTCALQPQPLTLSIEVADGALSRIDAVVCRLDKIKNCAEITVKKGAYASSPTVVAPVRNDNYDEIYLATINVTPGLIAISQEQITDRRLDPSVCGLMADSITKIDTAGIHAQVTGLITSLQKALADVFGGALPDKSVTEPKIADGAITTPKFAADARVPNAGYADTAGSASTAGSANTAGTATKANGIGELTASIDKAQGHWWLNYGGAGNVDGTMPVYYAKKAGTARANNISMGYDGNLHISFS